MVFLSSMNISASALTANRLRMDVIAENMANINTTRTENGEAYRRRYVVFQQIEETDNLSRFQNVFDQKLDQYTQGVTGGVRVVEIGEDQSPFKLDYNPEHPDANEEGYVELPNVDVVHEMVDMMAAYRAYEANVTALNSFKDMATVTLQIGKA